eukprot:COSAG04_NODE_216_length_19953_cov_85.343558_6_plen_77_part_00
MPRRRQRAQPEGCKGGDAASKSRWCYLHDDGSITLRNARRLGRSLEELATRRQELGEVHFDTHCHDSDFHSVTSTP